MSRHLMEIDEPTLSAARAELGTDTIGVTVNTALRIVAARRGTRIARALDVLAHVDLAGHGEAWP